MPRDEVVAGVAQKAGDEAQRGGERPGRGEMGHHAENGGAFHRRTAGPEEDDGRRVEGKAARAEEFAARGGLEGAEGELAARIARRDEPRPVVAEHTVAIEEDDEPSGEFGVEWWCGRHGGAAYAKTAEYWPRKMKPARGLPAATPRWLADVRIVICAILLTSGCWEDVPSIAHLPASLRQPLGILALVEMATGGALP